MGDVTAVNMDIVTDKSGHAFTPMAVSACITPMAPAPAPIPYPVTGTSTEGVVDECLRTKVNGGKCMTVGSVFKACHGNEPGTLKEVVSLNTGGPCFAVMGAPTVFIELGMASITGSPGFLNKAPTMGAGGSAGGASGASAGGGSGGDGSGGDGSGNNQQGSNGGGGGGGGGAGASAPTPAEKKLAAEENANPDDGKNAARVAARKKVANDFYQTKGQKYDPTANGGKGGNRPFKLPQEQGDIDDHTSGIDFNKPVKAGPPPDMPPKLDQIHGIGRKGQYFAPKGTTPEQLSVGRKGVDQSGNVINKPTDTYQMPPKGDYLESTASKKDDTWSVKGMTQPGDGGGTQYYVPDQSKATNLTGSP
jgi:hypothetical protein